MSTDCGRISQMLEELAIPSDFVRSEYHTGDGIISSLETWKQKSMTVLHDILEALKRLDGDDVNIKFCGDVVFAVAPFASRQPSLAFDTEDEQRALQADPWVSAEAQALADDVFSLPQFSPPSPDLLSQVLTHNLKPIFKSNPHPHLHLETGRKLSKAAGGSMAMQDYYEDQRWKEHPGVDKVVFWCVRAIEVDSYETMWHLIIPPVMTLLDDYEAKHKLQGVFVVQEMLQHVPKDLLKRTGVDGLLRQSLRTSLSHLQSPETAPLLKNAIFASISLTFLTTSILPGAQPASERFDQLSALLGDGIISGIWLYAADKPDVVQATFDALPQLLRALGIGSVRFLKALMPQVAHQIIPRTLVDSDRRVQLSALRVLGVLLEVCKPRIDSWKETILDAIGRCWVGLVDEEREGIKASGLSVASHLETKYRNDVKGLLQITCVRLAEICPSVKQVEFQRFLTADRELFKDLFASQFTAVS